jgi:hypothetical protein
MLALLNNRISRTLIAAILPASMSLGLAGNTFGQCFPTPPAVAIPQQPGAMVYSGLGLYVEFDSVSDGYLNGEIFINNTACPFALQRVDRHGFRGQFNYGNNVCPIAIQVRGDELYMWTMGLQGVVLQRVAA